VPVRTWYRHPLDAFDRVQLTVEFDTRRDEVVDYALIVTSTEARGAATVRVYDAAHGRNEMHRYTKKLGKCPAEAFHHGTLGEGMRTAIEAIKHGYEEMIDGWRRG
jgi:hypothetical protein